MADNISGVPGNNYSAEGLYRVKAMDRDARGGSGGGFFREERKRKQDQEDGAAEGNPGPDVIPPPLQARPQVEIHDDIHLSDAASKSFVPAVVNDSAVTPGSGKVSPVTDPEQPVIEPGPSGSHIDITA